jgi:hypothetical protein
LARRHSSARCHATMPAGCSGITDCANWGRVVIILRASMSSVSGLLVPWRRYQAAAGAAALQASPLRYCVPTSPPCLLSCVGSCLSQNTSSSVEKLTSEGSYVTCGGGGVEGGGARWGAGGLCAGLACLAQHWPLIALAPALGHTKRRHSADWPKRLRLLARPAQRVAGSESGTLSQPSQARPPGKGRRRVPCGPAVARAERIKTLQPVAAHFLHRLQPPSHMRPTCTTSACPVVPLHTSS